MDNSAQTHDPNSPIQSLIQNDAVNNVQAQPEHPSQHHREPAGHIYQQQQQAAYNPNPSASMNHMNQVQSLNNAAPLTQHTDIQQNQQPYQNQYANSHYQNNYTPAIQPQPQQPVGSGSSFNPSSPEGYSISPEMAPSTSVEKPSFEPTVEFYTPPSVETAPPAPEVQPKIETQQEKIETLASPEVGETLKSVEVPKTPEEPATEEEIQSLIHPADYKPQHVVDMRAQVDPLIEVTTTDSLTVEADKMEEEFIQGVREAHAN